MDGCAGPYRSYNGPAYYDATVFLSRTSFRSRVKKYLFELAGVTPLFPSCRAPEYLSSELSFR